MPPLKSMRTDIEHLPEKKRRELARIQEILFEEFELAKGPEKNTKKSARQSAGRILKLVLFGSYARGDWVDEAGKTAKGYQSDFDLLIVVNRKEFTDMATYWYRAEDRIIQDASIKTPIGVIVHTLSEVNEKLAQGQYFFLDIIHDGIALYELNGNRFAEPKPQTAADAHAAAKEYFEEWSERAASAFKGFKFYLDEKDFNDAAFMSHQTVERLYTCYLLTTTLYSPATHNVRKLRSFVEAKDERFRAVWPDEDRFQRRSFERLKDAYVKARYSKHYKIAEDELTWLGERAEVLAVLVKDACEERLDELARAVGA